MTFGNNNIEKIRRSNRKHYRDPIAIERRNKDIEIDKARNNKYGFYNDILEMEYGRKFN